MRAPSPATKKIGTIDINKRLFRKHCYRDKVVLYNSQMQECATEVVLHVARESARVFEKTYAVGILELPRGVAGLLDLGC